MQFSPAARTLVELASHGINVEAHGDAICYQPRSRMSPALLKRLQNHKPEILVLLDATSAAAALQRFMEALWRDQAWHGAWTQRFRNSRHANFESLERVLTAVAAMAREFHDRRDWAGFGSACNFLNELAHGHVWDGAEPIQDRDAWEIAT